MKKETIFPSSSVAEIQLTYTPAVKVSELPKIQGVHHAYAVLLEKWDRSKLEFVEQFKVLLLNRANRALGICTLSTGGVSGTIVDLKVLFAAALKSNASAIIVAHNHPSGNLFPSQYDISLTQKIREAGEILEIPLLDHLIITVEGFYSFKDKGAL